MKLLAGAVLAGLVPFALAGGAASVAQVKTETS